MNLQFNSLFQVFIDQKNNILLNSQSEQTVLDAEKYSLFSHFISKKKLEGLSSKLNSARNNKVLIFYNQLEELSQLNWLNNGNDNTVIEQNNIVGTNEFIEEYINECNELNLKSSYHLLLIENLSFLNRRPIKKPLRVLQIYQNNIFVSPLLSSFEEFYSYKLWVLKNRPVDAFMEKLGKGHSGLVDKPNIRCELEAVLKIEGKYSAIIDLKSKETKCYDLKYILKKQPSHLEQSERINLNSFQASCNQDGGTRILSSQQTLAKLKPYANQYFGYIFPETEVSETNSNIHIYRSGFYKSPQKIPSKISGSDFSQITLGKGVSKIQSKVSALCEAIERKNAQYNIISDKPSFTASSLTKRHYSFERLAPFSNYQYNLFNEPLSYESQRKQAIKKYDGTSINWQPTWSLSHNETVYVPSVLCFANTPFEDDKFGKWQPNGCAAGNNLEEAILQALFELIERDATAIWWYNKLERPSFNLTLIDPDYLNPLHVALDLEHEYWVLDLTVDTGVPAMAAIGRHKQNKGFIFGFGCHLKPEMAAQRALTELCQLIPIRNQNGAPFDFDAIKPESYLFPNNDSPRGEYSLAQTYDIKEDILAIVEKLKTLNLETLALDYSRPPIPISTAKVFVPGLCHIWPQLGNQRLYDTPVKLGWRKKSLNEQTINPQGLYI